MLRYQVNYALFSIYYAIFHAFGVLSVDKNTIFDINREKTGNLPALKQA